ncbi:MAG: hypothetical protein AABZ33_03435, partial [Chloroflexota bacterium]
RLAKVAGSDDDTEGHRRRLAKVAGSDDDTEGHRRRLAKVDGSDDDTEGHRRRLAKVDGSDDDTEGHSFLPDPLSSRLLAQAREREIQGRLRDRSLEKESRNPFRRSKG